MSAPEGLYTVHWTQSYEVYTTVYAKNAAEAREKADRVKAMESHDSEGDEVVVLDGETCVLESWAYPVPPATVHVWDDAPIVGEELPPPPKLNGALRSRFRKFLKERFDG